MNYTFAQIAQRAAQSRASDIHLTPGLPPSCRIDGAIAPLYEEPLEAGDTAALAASLMSPAQQEAYEEHGEVDFAFEVEGVGRLRINVFRRKGETAVAARILSAAIPAPRDLGIPDAVTNLTSLRRGLVLVTGVTGSGKSTTLASLIDIINSSYKHHIITLEDPIEYLHSHKKSIVNQREMGLDSKSYAPALRAALRQDPDVILVGEMRDLETIQTAVTAAETGHLVFSTLHTLGAANTVDRIIDVFPPHQQQQIRAQLADVLECVVSQQLLPKASGTGRRSAMEVMITNAAIKNHIRENKTFQIPSVIQTSRKNGMITMDDAIYELYQSGEISGDTALLFAQDRQSLGRKII